MSDREPRVIVHQKFGRIHFFHVMPMSQGFIFVAMMWVITLMINLAILVLNVLIFLVVTAFTGTKAARIASISALVLITLFVVLIVHSYSQPGNTAGYRSTSSTSIVAGGNIYEADDPNNTLGGGAYVEKCPQCSDGHVVFNLGVAPNVDPGTLQFNNVHVDKSGTYPMVVYYCDYYTTGNNGYISVNGGQGMEIYYPPAGNCLDQNAILGNLTVSVHLDQGNNTIKFYNPNAGTSYIDRIVIQPRSGN